MRIYVKRDLKLSFYLVTCARLSPLHFVAITLFFKLFYPCAVHRRMFLLLMFIYQMVITMTCKIDLVEVKRVYLQAVGLDLKVEKAES